MLVLRLSPTPYQDWPLVIGVAVPVGILVGIFALAVGWGLAGLYIAVIPDSWSHPSGDDEPLVLKLLVPLTAIIVFLLPLAGFGYCIAAVLPK